MPEGHDADAFREKVLRRYNLSLGNGLSKLAGKVFRIGHLGDFNELMLAGTLSGIDLGLAVTGVPHGGAACRPRSTSSPAQARRRRRIPCRRGAPPCEDRGNPGERASFPHLPVGIREKALLEDAVDNPKDAVAGNAFIRCELAKMTVAREQYP